MLVNIQLRNEEYWVKEEKKEKKRPKTNTTEGTGDRKGEKTATLVDNPSSLDGDRVRQLDHLWPDVLLLRDGRGVELSLHDPSPEGQDRVALEVSVHVHGGSSSLADTPDDERLTSSGLRSYATESNKG